MVAENAAEWVGIADSAIGWTETEMTSFRWWRGAPNGSLKRL